LFNNSLLRVKLGSLSQQISIVSNASAKAGRVGPAAPAAAQSL
jgi:hypothetical protein